MSGCGGSSATSEPLRAACRDGRNTLAQVRPITRLRDVAPTLRRVVGVERQAREALDDGDPLAGKLSRAIEAAERVLTQIQETDPLLMLTMSPLQTGVTDVRRSVANARGLVDQVCRRAS